MIASNTQITTILGQEFKTMYEKRRAKRIVDRKSKNEVSEEERSLLTLVAKIIVEIAIIEMDRDEVIKDGRNSLNKTSLSLIKSETKKL